MLQRLARLVPPRVVAAVLRTWFNGWCTARRFQANGRCFFGCSMGEDSVDHYMGCPRLHRHGQLRLRLHVAPTFEERGLRFFLLAGAHELSDMILTRRALLLAAAYRLYCRCRRQPAFSDQEVLRRALDQAVKEAAQGHVGALRAVDSVWADGDAGS